MTDGEPNASEFFAAIRRGDGAAVDADPTRASSDGRTAGDLADESGHAALAKLLRMAAAQR